MTPVERSAPAHVALGLLSVLVFAAVSVLARASNGPISAVDTALAVGGLAGTSFLVASRALAWRSSSAIPGVRAADGNRTAAEMFVTPLVVVLFTVIPKIEQQHQELGMGLRFSIGMLIAAFARRRVEPWLVLASALTIVLHSWDHPTGLTAGFVLLLLVLLGLSGLQRPERVDPVPSPDERVRVAYPVSESATFRSDRWSSTRPDRVTPLVIGIAAGAVLLAAALAPAASRLAWDPDGLRNRFGASLPPPVRPSDSLELAYKPTRNDTRIMRVLTFAPSPVFLRAQTFTEWNGSTWIRPETPSLERTRRIGLWQSRPSGTDAVLGHLNASTYDEQNVQDGVYRTTVIAEVPIRGITPIPVEPLAAVWTSIDDSTSAWLDDGTATPIQGEGPQSYVVLHRPSRSGVVDPDHPELLDLAKITPRVRDLARRIVNDGPGNDADLAARTDAIRQWVSSNVRYDLSVKAPPRTADPIEYLLFDSRAGSCTHFATATAALLRSVGVPARIATGFVAQTPSRPHELLVRAKDAHAWAEVPVEGGGWLSVDTTLGAAENPESPARNFGLPLRTIGWIAALGAAVFGAVFVARSVRARTRRTPGAAAWIELVEIGERLGVRRRPDTTVRSFVQAIDDRLQLHGGLLPLARSLETTTYGTSSAEPATELLGRAKERARELRRSERQAARRRRLRR